MTDQDVRSKGPIVVRRTLRDRVAIASGDFGLAIAIGCVVMAVVVTIKPAPQNCGWCWSACWSRSPRVQSRVISSPSSSGRAERDVTVVHSSSARFCTTMNVVVFDT
jgi:hypothetical protein